MAKGEIVAYLLSKGWSRSETANGLCGQVSEDPRGTGECYHVGKWCKLGWWPSMCAQHARRAQRVDDTRGY